MKVEVPECKRCFCCIPLRHGLLFWGYVKLIASLIFLGLIIFLTIISVNSMQRLATDEYDINQRMPYLPYFEIVIIVLLMLIVLLEISMSIVFIVGGHKKNLKLMKVFYYYSIVMLCLFIFGFAVSITIDFIFELPRLFRYTYYYKMAVFYMKVKIGAGILYTVIQLYIILLTRSEMRKLQNHSIFHFNNNAAEAQCKMESEDGLIEPQSNLNSEDKTEVKIGDDNVDVVTNNYTNLERDEKLMLNKYKQIKNDFVE